MNILTLKNISKQYAGHTAIRHLSFDIPENSIFGLLGPNGAGKTSLIRIITQILGLDSGEILYKNAPLKPEHIFRMGYLPEERGLYKKMRVGEQLQYLAMLKGLTSSDAKIKIMTWLKRFDLEDWRDKKIEDLSKGMQQKVQFIATILHDPELIILDEPFSGFDPINAIAIKEEIHRLKRDGKTVVLSTHRMETVEELCDNIVLINKGEKILSGSVLSIVQNSKKNIYSVEGRGSIDSNSFYSIFKKVDIGENYFKADIHLQDGFTSNDLLGSIMKTAEVLSFKEDLPSMNEIFISKVQETLINEKNIINS